MSEQKAADCTLIACEIGAYEGIRFIQSPTEPETDHTLLALKANVDAFAAKPERKHITEQARSRSGGIAVTESWYAKRGLMLVTVDEWCRLQSEIADRDEWLDELEARYRNALERLRVLAPKQDAPAEPSIGALLLRAREADKRLGRGDAGRER